jgi:2-polyprenyl-6-methoxyphenol hydroxylase-like FAD-dependent oxidoreductase
MFRREHYDVVIVGARCAGAATAMLLARAGARVLVVDRQPYGSDTLSTHALMRPAVIQLARWGLLKGLIAGGTPVVTTTSFHYGEEVVSVAIRPAPGIPGLIAPRRTVLDRALVDAARAAGAEVVHDVAVTHLLRSASGRVSGVVVAGGRGRIGIKAETVIGADGLGSMVARSVQAEPLVRGTASVAHIYAYVPAPSGTGYHWHFREGISGFLIPTNDGRSCLVASVPTATFDMEFRRDIEAGRLCVLEALSPELADLAQSEASSAVRTFRGARGLLRQAFGPGWLLVGDAGFFRDPLTAHGISDALRDAEGVARAVIAGSDLVARRYQEERDAYALPILAATDSICAFDWTLEGLGERHQRFSDAMKAEVSLLTDRASAMTQETPDISRFNPPSHGRLAISPELEGV